MNTYSSLSDTVSTYEFSQSARSLQLLSCQNEGKQHVGWLHNDVASNTTNERSSPSIYRSVDRLLLPIHIPKHTNYSINKVD